MRLLEATSGAISLYVVIICVFKGQDAYTQVMNDPVESAGSQSVIEEPRYSFLAKVTEEKPNQGTSPADNSISAGGNEDSYSDSFEYYSSSEEEEQLLGHINSTLSTPVGYETTTTQSPQDKISQLLSKVQQGQLIKPGESDTGHNWYVVKNSPPIRSVETITVLENVENENTSNTSNGDASGILMISNVVENSDGSVVRGRRADNAAFKRPYNVSRAKPKDIVDPEGYSFFQFKPYSKLGWLWLSRVKGDGRGEGGITNDTDTGGNEGDGDPSNEYDWEFRRYDRACLYVEYKKQKADATIPLIQEELKRIVDSQNEQLARRFLDWQFINKESHESIALQGEDDKHPLFLTYKFLLFTMELFRDKICRNASSYAVASAASAPPGGVTRALATANTVDAKLLPKSFVEEIFRLFLTLREITLTKNVPDYATQLDDDEVYKEILEKCRAEEENINWFSHSCGDQILSNDQPNNFACTPLVDYDYNSKVYDPILDGMWHMFNSVHAYCFKHFQVNTRLWHRYSLIIANSYTVPMRQRWKASTASKKFYVRLLGPDHEVHLETMNRCMFGTTLRTDVPAVIPRFDSTSPITFGKERIIHKDGTVGSSNP